MSHACNLIIDSCCDLPYEVVDREGVYLLRFPYYDSKGEHFDDLFHETKAKDFYEGMRKGEEPHTAQLTMQMLRAAFEWAHEQGKPAVYLAFSSGLSGTYDTACLVLEQMRQEIEGLDITVVDTHLASTGEAFLVYEALHQWERGMTAQELAHWAEEARFFVRTYFMVEDLEALQRGGRIPAALASAGAKLDVKPLLTIDMDGTLGLKGVARGRKKGLKALCDYYCKNHTDQEVKVVAIGDADAKKDARKLGELIKDVDETTILLDTNVGPVIGSHVGPGMVSLVFWGTDLREDLSVADKIANRIRTK